jgi:MFS transporter, MCT family, solute carrier family 16 (monocarboxylic acid transporters), member 9
MHRHSLTYRGAMLNINRYRLRASSCPDIYRNSMTTIAKEKTDLWYQGMGEFRNLIVGILDISYFSDIRFLLFAISNFLLYTWYDVPYVYLSDNAVEMGFSETEGASLIAIIGIVNMVAEILLGWMGDQKAISANIVYAICMGLCGVVIALIPVFTGFNVLALLAGLFGMFIAANYSLTSIILVELITLEKFTSAYGLLLLVQGIANLVGPPLAGK